MNTAYVLNANDGVGVKVGDGPGTLASLPDAAELSEDFDFDDETPRYDGRRFGAAGCHPSKGKSWRGFVWPLALFVAFVLVLIVRGLGCVPAAKSAEASRVDWRARVTLAADAVHGADVLCAHAGKYLATHHRETDAIALLQKCDRIITDARPLVLAAGEAYDGWTDAAQGKIACALAHVGPLLSDVVAVVSSAGYRDEQPTVAMILDTVSLGLQLGALESGSACPLEPPAPASMPAAADAGGATEGG